MTRHKKLLQMKNGASAYYGAPRFIEDKIRPKAAPSGEPTASDITYKYIYCASSIGRPLPTFVRCT